MSLQSFSVFGGVFIAVVLVAGPGTQSASASVYISVGGCSPYASGGAYYVPSYGYGGGVSYYDPGRVYVQPRRTYGYSNHGADRHRGHHKSTYRHHDRRSKHRGVLSLFGRSHSAKRGFFGSGSHREPSLKHRSHGSDRRFSFGNRSRGGRSSGHNGRSGRHRSHRR